MRPKAVETVKVHRVPNNRLRLLTTTAHADSAVVHWFTVGLDETDG